MFSGYLSAGETTNFYAGSSFIVFTTYGAGTEFTNDRGEVFFMGYEEGEATYYL